MKILIGKIIFQNPNGNQQSTKTSLLGVFRRFMHPRAFSKNEHTDFHGGPVVKISPSNARGVNSIPDWIPKIP